MPLRIKETSYCGICPILNDCMNDGNWQTCSLNKYLMRVDADESKERYIYLKTIDKFSKQGQVIKLFEEMSELQKELCKDLNGDVGKEMKIAEEIADVKIMLEQIELIYNMSYATEIYKQYKLNLLAEKIKL